METTCMVKLLEFILASVCLTLHHYSFDLTDLPSLMLCSGTYMGYIVVISGEIIGEMSSASADVFVEAWWSATGAALFAASGFLTMRSWRDVPQCARRSHAQSAAVCALATAAVLAIDTLLAVCSQADETTGSQGGKSTKSNKACRRCQFTK